MKTYIYTYTLVITLALLAVAQNASAAWGDYDTTFGFLGAAIDGSVVNHYPVGVAVQPDGKILVTGYRMVGGKKRFFLRRYHSNGQVDTSFGNNGSATSNAFLNSSADYSGSRIVVQANGRIAVAGLGGGYATIWRFLSSGSADNSIGMGGMKTLTTYPDTTPRIATHSNILYAAIKKPGSVAEVVIKFNSNGTRDLSFGSGGEATTGGTDITLGIEPATGNILIGGRNAENFQSHGVERMFPTGVLDGTFNAYSATVSHPHFYTSRFLRLSNGQFVVNERGLDVGGALFFWANLVRLSSNGAFTSSTEFEPREMIYPAESPTGPCPEVLAQQGDGRVILKGNDFDELFRFSADFASVQTMSCGSYANLDYPKSHAVLQSDDKMVAAGRYNGYITLVRTLP
ncbi:MAG TPA: hypothetical protein DEP46_04470 [Blastocatellia bacterium]|nr:hypothetical protein [Blastocatellia bacterium]